MPLRRKAWLPAVSVAVAAAGPLALAHSRSPEPPWPPGPPRRIVSAALAGDEMLLELVEHRRIAGVTYLVDDPLASAAAGRAPAHAARVHGPVEPIVALVPDRVLAAPFLPAETLTLLRAAKLPVVRLRETRSFEDVLDNIELVGRALGAEHRAQELALRLAARLRAVAALRPVVPAPRVLVWTYGYAFGRETLVDDCIRRAGGRNVLRARGEVTIGIEGAVGLEPDVIFVSSHESSVRRDDRRLLAPSEAWRGTRAIAHGIPAAWVGSVSQHSVLALEAISALLREGA